MLAGLSRAVGRAGVSRRSRRAAGLALSRRPAPSRSLCSKGEAATEGGAADKGGALNWYLRQLDENPLVTKSLTSMVIVGAGDVLCQGVLEVRRRVVGGTAASSGIWREPGAQCCCLGEKSSKEGA